MDNPLAGDWFIVRRRPFGTRYRVTDADGVVLLRVTCTFAAVRSLLAIAFGLAASMSLLVVGIVLQVGVLRLPEPFGFVFVTTLMLVGAVGAAAAVLAIRRSIGVYREAERSVPMLTIRETARFTFTDPEFVVLDASGESIAQIAGLALIGRAGVNVARAELVQERALAAKLVRRLGIAADLLGSECYAFKSAKRRVGEVRRHSMTLGGALVRLRSSTIDRRALFALGLVVEMFKPVTHPAILRI